MLTALLSLLLLVPARAAGDPSWDATLERVIRAVVVLRVDRPRSFDGVGAGTIQGTGFVIDARRGLLLTNRHVIGPGPGRAVAVFQDREEVPVRLVYRDPVHDYAVVAYDPAALVHADPPELPLAPGAARVGLEIRVVGNDAGNQLSILPGILARIDQPAPHYGRHYNDFNTFYFQAASSTSGGSSGSPVVDREGRVIALNAGARKKTATSYFLPLDRVVPVVDALRAGRPIPRGTFQVVFRYRPYGELRRLGLDPATETAWRERFPEATGMLVVETVLPGGPADGRLRPGDVLLSVEGRPVPAFAPLEAILDAHVGETLAVEIERAGERLRTKVRCDDLHALVPDAFVQVGGAMLHDLSIHQALDRQVAVRGVYVATAGYDLRRAGIPRHALLVEVDGRPVRTLDDLWPALTAVPEGGRIPVVFTTRAQPRVPRTASFAVQRRWHPLRRCAVASEPGDWRCEDAAPPPTAEPPPPRVLQAPVARGSVARRLASSLVTVDFDIPHKIDGVYGQGFRGTGLVVDARRGWVVVDRDTVPIPLGDVTVTFGGTARVPGRVVALHPVHDLALVAYDPALLEGDRPAAPELRDRPIRRGDHLWAVGPTEDHEIAAQRVEVTATGPLLLPPASVPRYRDHTIEVARVDLPTGLQGGVLADRRGRAVAFLASFAWQDANGTSSYTAAIPIHFVQELVRHAESGLAYRTAGLELRTLPLADAVEQGLPPEAADAIRDGGRDRTTVLQVLRVLGGGPTEGLVRPGDFLLAVDGRPVATFRAYEEATQAAGVTLTLARQGAVREVAVETEPLDLVAPRRFAFWSGAYLEDPTLPVRLEAGVPPLGVYVSLQWYGSPADRYGLGATDRIVEVDGRPVPDLATFLDAVAGATEDAAIRLLLVDLSGRRRLVPLVPDPTWWPTEEFAWKEGTWTRTSPTDRR